MASEEISCQLRSGKIRIYKEKEKKSKDSIIVKASNVDDPEKNEIDESHRSQDDFESNDMEEASNVNDTAEKSNDMKEASNVDDTEENLNNDESDRSSDTTVYNNDAAAEISGGSIFPDNNSGEIDSNPDENNDDTLSDSAIRIISDQYMELMEVENRRLKSENEELKKELEQVKKEKENLLKRLKEETSIESSVDAESGNIDEEDKESSSEEESVRRKEMELRIAQLKEEIKNFKKNKPGYYVEPNTFPIKEGLKKKMKKQHFPDDPCGFVLGLMRKLYTRDFLELHKKTNTEGKVGEKLKKAIPENQLFAIRGAVIEVFNYETKVEERLPKDVEFKIGQKFNIVISKENREWLKKLKDMEEQVEDLIDNL